MTRRALPALAMLLLAACSSAPQYEIPAGPPPTTAPTGDALFEQLLTRAAVSHDGLLDYMIPAARQLCVSMPLLDGTPAEQRESAVGLLMATGNFGDEQAARGFLSATVSAYCPEHEEVLGR
ncbi:DUF732 domain-containing protein [Rhodococcus sp. (in: high G+C Gram-positive bacteria)]|uniref:DUF732 domain-containing protein n=1 Tax=Rhodococcus sp. TaxID=1831 RepID=UPI00258E09B9|nr:DUF732 domain-containing protein [Rhodococcus sp. (in: high G+C Gram-positive bacteria)]